ncbi:MAG: type II toxin-antitoxin system RelE/ParE family toxin [Chitinophagaceae bacterium]|jgi:hypothetical protein|nr:type II toxin-antitoxin system RelE/ParE family toxin [Chitinophagaceae bacterium]
MIKIVFSKEALQDFEEAKNYYESKQVGLGNRFTMDVDDIIAKIIRNPFFASVRFSNIRAPKCKHFPFQIHYEIDETNELVRIVSIFNSYRKPWWMAEISDEADE